MAMTPNPTGNYIKEITLPSGTKYEIVDEGARTQINTMSSYSAFLGVVSNSAAWTKIEDGSTTGTILVGSTTTTVTTGNIVIYKPSNSTSAAQEFIWDGSKWNFFGDISAQNLGALAYKNSGTYHKITAINNGSSAVTASGSFTPSGGVTLTKSGVTLAISSTSTDPGAGNTANYWIYKPAGTISVTYTTVNASATVVDSVTAKQVVLSVTTTAPTTASVTNGLNYTSVNDHNLSLAYLVVPVDTAATITTTKAYVSTKTAKTTTCSFDGTTQYVKPLTVTVATAASFSGTAATVTVNSGTNKFLTSVTATSAANTAVTFS